MPTRPRKPAAPKKPIKPRRPAKHVRAASRIRECLEIARENNCINGGWYFHIDRHDVETLVEYVEKQVREGKTR